MRALRWREKTSGRNQTRTIGHANYPPVPALFIPNWCAALSEAVLSTAIVWCCVCNTEGDEQRMNRNPGDADAKR